MDDGFSRRADNATLGDGFSLKVDNATADPKAVSLLYVGDVGMLLLYRFVLFLKQGESIFNILGRLIID